VGERADRGNINGIVTDNREASRFELREKDDVAFLEYERRDNAMVLVHTEVPPALRGRHLGDKLVQAALDAARAENRRVVTVCPFARAYLRKHPQ
jgi:predicted GNAT family acetyltransferase